MRVQFSARHCSVPETIRERTEELLGKLTKFEPRLSAADVVFETLKHVHQVEAVLTVAGDEPVVAGGEGADFKAAVDQLVDRLAEVLRRRRSQVRDHQSSRPGTLPEVVAD